MLRIEHHWYRRSLTWLTLLLLPLSYIFHIISLIRIFLYRFGIKKTIHFSMPIIVVGNVTAGGTGKTPLVIWLANFLKSEGFAPGIVSRGMGGKKQHSPLWLDAASDPEQIGDEAILLAKHTSCPVVVCIDRVAAVKELLGHTACNVILSDDGLQHYRLGRAIEIAVLDGERGLGNRCYLPAGPLRESPKRLQKVDFVIQQGGEKSHYFQMQLEGEKLVSIKDSQNKMQLQALSGQTVNAVAGIGNPERFFTLLQSHGLQVIEHIFPDHYLYQASDFNAFNQYPIIMTEKDAVKCIRFADERYWYLPVAAKLSPDFSTTFLERVRRLYAKN